MDIFDRIMCLPVLRVFRPFYQKYKEQLLYLFFGALTTLVSIGVFGVFSGRFGWNEHPANVISWICAVSFAFFTNRVWVFRAETHGAASFFRQMASFFGGRLATLGVEELLLLVFITWLGWKELIVKIGAQFVIVVLNYVVSKLWIFKGTSE